MNKAELRRRFPRCAVLVVADFAAEMSEVRVLRELGARVLAAGLGGEAERRGLTALGIDAEGVVESRGAALEQALDRMAAADVVLFGAGDWEAERQEMLEAEREEAIADGRSLRSMLSAADERFSFLGSPAERARFALAWAAGAGFEEAKAFAGTGARKGSVDTRTKIVDRRQAVEAARQVRAAGKGVKLVMGNFDPLVADHARRLREIATPDSAVFAAICESEHPILPARARAVLVAALGMVDYVILPEQTDCEGFAELLRPEELYREQDTDARRTRDLIQHVQKRHS